MTDDEEIPLLGGDVTEGVVRVGNTVRRPPGEAAEVVRALLQHLAAVGFDGAPRFLGVDAKGRDILTYIDGEVAGRPRPDWIADEDRMVSVARLVRRYDDAALSFGLPADRPAAWQRPDLPGMPPDAPSTPAFLGHLDITPENVVFVDGAAAALIDFDLIRPAARLDEVVNAMLWWVPLFAPADRDPRQRDLDVPARARVFADAYGLDATDRARLVAVYTVRTQRTWFTMRHRAETLGGGWARMWAEGVGDVIRRRETWIADAGPAITAALLDGVS